MASVSNKHIDGDATVARHVTAGGNVTVRGSAKIDHNLKVSGYLDAPNLRGPIKGLFLSEESLNSAYPNPKSGWAALVGTTLPAHVYMAIDGKWTPQYNDDGTPKTGGEFNLALDDYVDQVNDLSDRVDDLETDMAAAKKDITAATQTANNAKTIAEAAKEGVQTLNDKIGRANGIAPLGADGKVPLSNLPNDLNEVIEIGTTVAGVTALETTTAASNIPGCSVVYDAESKALLLAMTRIGGAGGSGDLEIIPAQPNPNKVVGTISTSYYKHWADAESYGTVTDSAVKPTAGKVYINRSEMQLMIWTGTELKAVPPGDMERITEAEIDEMFY